MAIFSELLGAVPTVVQIGRAVMGKPAIVAKAGRSCDWTFTDRDMLKGSRQWALRIQTTPEHLELRNGEGLHYYFEASIHRVSKGTLRHRDQEQNSGARYIRREEPIVIWLEPVPTDWISNQTSDWSVEIWVHMGSVRKLIYSGPPTSIRVERE